MALPTSLRQRLKNKSNLKSSEIVLPPNEDSKAVALSYNRDLNRLINQMTKEVRQVLLPIAKKAKKENLEEMKQVIDAPMTEVLLASINGIKSKYEGLIDYMALKIARDFVEKNVFNNVNNFRKEVKKMTGGVSLENILVKENLKPVIENAIETNVSLIKSIPRQYFDKLEYIIFQNMTDSRTGSRNLIEEIQHLTGVTRNRAKTIARDQNSKTNASITQARSISLGVKKYVWQTSGDERVRPTHKRNNGKTFFWNKPPPVTGHPSHDVNCRCVALSVVDLDNF